LFGDGAVALAPRAQLIGVKKVWVRNGLGETVRGSVEHDAGQLLEVVLIRLDVKLPVPAWKRAAREPFAGGPGSVFEYAPDALGRPAWPLTYQGFFAGIPRSSPTRPLGVAVPAGSCGGVVLDAAGRLAGMAIESADSRAPGDRLVGLEQLR